MRFVKALWKLLVGVKDALVLLLMLLFFGGIYAALSARPSPAVTDGVLAFDMAGALVEQPAESDVSSLLTGGGSGPKQYALRQMKAALLASRDDARVKAVALDLDRFAGGGQAAIADLGATLDQVRRVKPVLAYATSYSDDRYQLAAHASEIWLNPLGQVATVGPGGNQLYYKGLFDKLGVTANVYRVGTYKAAVEPYIRNDMSPAAREDSQALASTLFETWRDDIRRARPKANLEPYLKDPIGTVRAANGEFAKAAQTLGLVDQVGDRDAFSARLRALGGNNDRMPGGFNRIRLDSYLADKGNLPSRGPIGVVTVAGTIVDGRAPLGTAGGDSIADAIDKGIRSGKLKALVVRIDSPGGSVTGSERIRSALLSARAAGIPVVASMGNVAASGGYWVSTAATRVLAEPSTITGSIGVFGVIPSFQGSLAKLGVGVDGVKTTPLSGEPDIFKGPSPEAGQLAQLGVETIYRHFLRIVSVARHKTPEAVDQIAQGRVWAGGPAHQLGLVDRFGNLDDAIAEAAGLAKLGDERGVTYLERPKSLRASLMSFFRDGEDTDAADTDAFAAIGGRSRGDLVAALADAREVLNGPAIQVRCLECGALTPVRTIAPRDRSAIESLIGWLLG
jgi:protease IV